MSLPATDNPCDEADAARFEIERCYAQGCTARLALDNSMLSVFKKGNMARVTVQEKAGQDVHLKVSLSGFSAGFRALSSASQQ